MKRKTKFSRSTKELNRIHQSEFYHRIKMICYKMVAAGIFEKLPARMLRKLYSIRYRPINIRIHSSEGVNIYKGESEIYVASLNEYLLHYNIETMSGQKISFKSFLSDVISLIHYIQFSILGKFKGAAIIHAAFSPYFTDSEWYQNNRKKALQIFGTIANIFSNFTKYVLTVDAGSTAIAKPGQVNTLDFYKNTANSCVVKIDGKNRSLFQVATVSSENTAPDWLWLNPAQLGFKQNNPMPVYFQHHALNRFFERTSFPVGFAAAYLVKGKNENTLKYHANQYRSLVEFTINNHKIGYFVIAPLNDKLVIRTFLFLTNESTPEGKQLANFTHLRTADRQFLDIDKLSAFVKYDMSNDRELKDIFVKGGCCSLIDFADMIRKECDINAEKATAIHRYLIRSLHP